MSFFESNISFAAESSFLTYKEALELYQLNTKQIKGSKKNRWVQDKTKINYQQIFKTFRKYSDEDNFEAMSYMAQMYEAGLGTKKDMEKAIYYHKLASRHDIPLSMLYLSSYYLNGKVVHKDYKKAKEILDRLAMLGDPRAYTNLGVIYEKGYGVSVDYKKAFESYSKCAKSDVPDCLHALGEMYFFGKHIKKNYTKAFDLFSKAYSSGFSYSSYFLGYSYLYGKGVKVNYDKANQYLRNYTLNVNDKYRTLHLGLLKERGHIKEKEHSRAYHNYSAASKFNVYCGDFSLARLYKAKDKFLGIERDLKRYIKLTMQSVNEHCLDAAVIMSQQYKSGNYLKRDIRRSEQYDEFIQQLLFIDNFEKHTGNVYLTIEEYYGRPYIHDWLNREAKNGNLKTQQILKLLEEHEKYH